MKAKYLIQLQTNNANMGATGWFSLDGAMTKTAANEKASDFRHARPVNDTRVFKRIPYTIQSNQLKDNQMNIFEQFAGADLERLAECIKAVRTANLSTSKYTQAGVNQSSGNVWIWDEDWAGAVACSVAFDVNWYHSCPECGEEYDFKIYLDLQDYIEKHDGHCELCKPRYVAGWNIPGYMPDSEPMEFDTAADAMEYIKDEMRRDAEDNAPEADLDELIGQIEAFKADKNGEFGAGFLAYHYFISHA